MPFADRIPRFWTIPTRLRLTWGFGKAYGQRGPGGIPLIPDPEAFMNRLSYWGLLGVMALALSAGGYYFLNREVEDAGTALPAKAATKPQTRVVTVEARRVAVDTVVDTIRAVGTLRANESVVISPEIAGRIARLPFREGDRVAAGAPLVELDASILRAEMDKAQSDLTLAEANRTRALTLARQGTGTLRARDEAVAAFEVARANVALARARLEKATITAPMAGTVGIRAVSVGAYVSAGDAIVELAETDPIKVDFRVPELALSSLKVGQPIRVSVDAFAGRFFDGKIYIIDPIVDANGRAIRLRARIPNPDGLLSPGLFARVEIVVARRENALLIPESAVFTDGDGHFVYSVDGGRAVRTKVELGQRRPGEVEVLRGLAPGATVVTAGHQKLRDGDRVKLMGGGV